MTRIRPSTLVLFLSASVAPAASAQTHRVMIGPNGVADNFAPVRSMEELKYAGIVRQRFDFSCGSAALATLLRLYGDPHGEAKAFRGMWEGGDQTQIRKLGFSLLDMKRYLETLGRPSNGYKVTLEQIEKTGVPGIALVTVRGYKHFVVVLGVKGDEVLVGDPSLGLQVQSTKDFERDWNGVFFVIDSELEKGRRAFNARARWAAYPRSPIGMNYTDPVSQQALALTAPFYRDF